MEQTKSAVEVLSTDASAKANVTSQTHASPILSAEKNAAKINAQNEPVAKTKDIFGITNDTLLDATSKRDLGKRAKVHQKISPAQPGLSKKTKVVSKLQTVVENSSGPDEVCSHAPKVAHASAVPAINELAIGKKQDRPTNRNEKGTNADGSNITAQETANVVNEHKAHESADTGALECVDAESDAPLEDAQVEILTSKVNDDVVEIPPLADVAKRIPKEEASSSVPPASVQKQTPARKLNIARPSESMLVAAKRKPKARSDLLSLNGKEGLAESDPVGRKIAEDARKEHEKSRNLFEALNHVFDDSNMAESIKSMYEKSTAKLFGGSVISKTSTGGPAVVSDDFSSSPTTKTSTEKTDDVFDTSKFEPIPMYDDSDDEPDADSVANEARESLKFYVGNISVEPSPLKEEINVSAGHLVRYAQYDLKSRESLESVWIARETAGLHQW